MCLQCEIYSLLIKLNLPVICSLVRHKNNSCLIICFGKYCKSHTPTWFGSSFTLVTDLLGQLWLMPKSPSGLKIILSERRVTAASSCSGSGLFFCRRQFVKHFNSHQQVCRPPAKTWVVDRFWGTNMRLFWDALSSCFQCNLFFYFILKTKSNPSLRFGHSSKVTCGSERSVGT